MIQVTANARKACAVTDDLITTGSIGIPVSFLLSADFDGLSNIAVFRGSGVTVDVILTDNTCVVPPETLVTANSELWIGVYGRNADGTIAIPTVWAGAFNIHYGAVPSGVDPSEPTPDWTAQVQAAATEALQIARSVEAQAQTWDFDSIKGIVTELAQDAETRVTSLDETAIVHNGKTVNVIGIPVFVSDVSDYSEYGIAESGWYVFARVTSKDGTTVTDDTSVIGSAGHIATVGNNYIDVAVLFTVTAPAQTVVINWGTHVDTFIFTAYDLAVRNLDYRTTFYVYDIAEFVRWDYVLTADATFATNKNYYTLADGVYTLAEVTAGEAVPAETYYNHSKLHIEGMARNVTYRLNDIVDCPIEIALPEIDDDGHGAWFEIQMRYNGSYSCTLVPPTSDVKVGTVTTQLQTAGVNVVDLHYANVNGAKVWSLINTHSNIPA